MTSRISLFKLLALSLTLSMSTVASAQTFPNKPLKMVVPAAPGGGADFLARIVGAKLGEALGQSVVIENRAGASGTIAADMVAKSPADGYTMLLGQSTSMAIAPHLYEKLNYDTLRDLKPVTLVAEVPNMLVVHPSVPANNVRELIALAKAKPDSLNFGSAGSGAPSHLAGEMFKSAAGVKMTHVPYRGAGPAVNALLAGEIQVMFGPIVAVLPQVKGGKLKAIAVTTSKRTPAAPDVPTVAESGLAGYEIASWFGLFVPAATPPAIIDRLHRETAKVLSAPDVVERLAKEGADPVGNTPAEFDKFVRAEYAVYGKVVKDNNIKAD